MISDTSLAVMRRLAKPARPTAADAGLDEGRAWRILAPRAAEEAAGLVLNVRGFDVTEVFLDDLTGDWPAGTLAMMLAAEGQGPGLALVDAALVSGLIEVQITGRVLGAAPAERPSTDTDAALVGHMVERWMHDVAEMLGQGAAWRVGARAPDPRAAQLALEECAYLRRTVRFDLGDGAKEGTLTLACPSAPPARAVPKGADPRLDAAAELRAVLHRVDVPLRRIRGLSPGDVLALPGARIGAVAVETPEGRRVAAARLGRLGPHRALRIGSDQGEASTPQLSGDPMPELIAEPLPGLPPATTSEKLGTGLNPQTVSLTDPIVEPAADLALELPDLPPLPGDEADPDLPPLAAPMGLADLPQDGE